MRRRLSLLLATVLAGGMLTFLAPPQTAGAVKVCAGTGQAFVTPGLKGPIAVNLPATPIATTLPLGTQLEILIGKANNLHSFFFNFGGGAGGCSHPPNSPLPTEIAAAGSLKGYCGHSSGTGTLSSGELFAWVSVGGLLIITGHIVGVVNAIPDPDSTTGSCIHFHNPVQHAWSLNNGATRFLITGAVVGMNCLPGLVPLVPGTPQDTEFLQRIIDTSVLSPDGSVHWWINLGIHFYWNHLCVGAPLQHL